MLSFTLSFNQSSLALLMGHGEHTEPAKQAPELLLPQVIMKITLVLSSELSDTQTSSLC